MYCYFCMKETAEQSGCCTCCGKPYAQNAGPNCLAPGTVLKDKYMIGAVLGKGGFGVTYAGRDTTLDLRIAVKEYFPDGHANRNVMMTNDVTLTTGPNEEYFLNGKERFLTEAKTLAKFNRAANIVHARDYFEANGTAYIVMDFVEGDSLKNYLRENGRIEPVGQVLRFEP